MSEYEHPKKMAEYKHRLVYNHLVKNLPGTTSKYNHDDGLDCWFKFNDKLTWIEIKTCNRIVKNNFKRKDGSPMLMHEHNLGRFHFDKKQNDELLLLDGWYVFAVGCSVKFGVKAKDLNLKFTDNPLRKLSWLDVVVMAYPDWLRRIKCDVYGI
jgi:hypothetical protein